MRLDQFRESVHYLLTKDGEVTSASLSDLMRCSPETANKRLRQLRDEGILEVEYRVVRHMSTRGYVTNSTVAVYLLKGVGQ